MVQPNLGLVHNHCNEDILSTISRVLGLKIAFLKKFEAFEGKGHLKGAF